MALGSFTVTVDGNQLGLGTESAASIRVQFASGRQFVIDSDAGLFVFPHLSNSKPVAVSLPYELTLVTDVDTGVSEEIGYVVTVTTAAGGRVAAGPFPAQADGAAIALTDVTSDFEGQVSESLALRAEEAAVAAEAARAAAEAVGSTNDTIIAGRINDPASATATALSATVASEGAALFSPIDPGFALLPARAALANRATAPFTIFCLGDSITEGGNASAQSKRWVDRLRANLRTLRPTDGVVVGGDTSYIPAVDPSALWNRGNITGSGWTTGTYYGYGGRALTMTGTSKVTFTVTGTDIAVVGPTSGGLGVFSVVVDGGAPTLVSAGTPGGDNEHYWPVALGSSGSHTVEISVNSGTVVLNGIRVYNGANDDTTGIHVLDAGHSGWRAIDHDPAGDLPDQIANADPQLAIIALMANDTYATVTPVATYKARLIALGNLFRGSQPYGCSVLFLAYPKRGSGGASVWPDYVQAMREAAVEINGGGAFLDIGERVPAYDDWGYPYFDDTVHLTDATHGMVADAITDLLVR